MAYTGIASVVFGAPDIRLASRFFSDWGLSRVAASRAGAVFAAAGGGRLEVRRENAAGLPPRLGNSNFRELVWGVPDRRQLAAIAGELARDRDVAEGRDGSIHSVDDSGIHIGFMLAMPAGGTARPPTAYNSPGRRARVDRVGPVYARARPSRMGHIAFFVPDVKAAEAFYVRRLGFWLSDRYAGGAAVFLRCAARSDHHNLFFLKSRSGASELHHIAFEVADIHEVFGGGRHFAGRGWPTAVGPGRHPISSAYFWYFRNPLGGMIEYFCDPDFVTEKWKPTNYRVNRFSEWHLADGIAQRVDTEARPSLAMARAIERAGRRAA